MVSGNLIDTPNNHEIAKELNISLTEKYFYVRKSDNEIIDKKMIPT